MFHINFNSKFNSYQKTFIKPRSSTSNLVTYLDYVSPSAGLLRSAKFIKNTTGIKCLTVLSTNFLEIFFALSSI
jgi:hypothetical protein